MNLYEIDEAIMNCVDAETGEIIDEEQLSRLQMERDEKIENVALWIKNLNADAEAFNAEKKAFEVRQKEAENKAKFLKGWLSRCLAGSAYKSTKVTISFRRSESVQINDIDAIADFDTQYIRYAEPTADKMAIKKALKDGIAIPGAELVESQNIQIK